MHQLHSGDMPTGAIGRSQLQRGGPLPGYFQPVEIKAPKGAMISLAIGGQFDSAVPAPRAAGMLLGSVYRFQVSRIPLNPGLEIYPTIEVIDRIYPPPGAEGRYPIPVELTVDDLAQAAAGKLVTRVIYLEDPHGALPVAEKDGHQPWFDVGPGQDPLHVADSLGRPVAILRMGALLPSRSGPDAHFLFGSPRLIPMVRPRTTPAVAPPQRLKTPPLQQGEEVPSRRLK